MDSLSLLVVMPHPGESAPPPSSSPPPPSSTPSETLRSSSSSSSSAAEEEEEEEEEVYDEESPFLPPTYPPDVAGDAALEHEYAIFARDYWAVKMRAQMDKRLSAAAARTTSYGRGAAATSSSSVSLLAPAAATATATGGGGDDDKDKDKIDGAGGVLPARESEEEEGEDLFPHSAAAAVPAPSSPAAAAPLLATKSVFSATRDSKSVAQSSPPRLPSSNASATTSSKSSSSSSSSSSPSSPSVSSPSTNKDSNSNQSRIESLISRALNRGAPGSAKPVVSPPPVGGVGAVGRGGGPNNNDDDDDNNNDNDDKKNLNSFNLNPRAKRRTSVQLATLIEGSLFGPDGRDGESGRRSGRGSSRSTNSNDDDDNSNNNVDGRRGPSSFRDSWRDGPGGLLGFTSERSFAAGSTKMMGKMKSVITGKLGLASKSRTPNRHETGVLRPTMQTTRYNPATLIGNLVLGPTFRPSIYLFTAAVLLYLVACMIFLLALWSFIHKAFIYASILCFPAQAYALMLVNVDLAKLVVTQQPVVLFYIWTFVFIGAMMVELRSQPYLPGHVIMMIVLLLDFLIVSLVDTLDFNYRMVFSKILLPNCVILLMVFELALFLNWADCPRTSFTFLNHIEISSSAMASSAMNSVIIICILNTYTAFKFPDSMIMIKSRTEVLTLNESDAVVLRAVDAVARKTSNANREQDVVSLVIGRQLDKVDRVAQRQIKKVDLAAHKAAAKVDLAAHKAAAKAKEVGRKGLRRVSSVVPTHVAISMPGFSGSGTAGMGMMRGSFRGGSTGGGGGSKVLPLVLAYDSSGGLMSDGGRPFSPDLTSGSDNDGQPASPIESSDDGRPFSPDSTLSSP